MANPNFKENKFKRFIAKSLQPLFRFVSKKQYVSLQYRYITGHKLDWKNLNRYTEKLQYLRLYYFANNDEVVRSASRIGARIRVNKHGLGDILIPLVGIYNTVSEINFEKLPFRFVIKATHASSFVHVCTNKNEEDWPTLKAKLIKWLHIDYGERTVEPHYSKIKPALIIEQYVGTPKDLPREYKIHVFNGKARYLYVVSGRNKDIRYDNFYIDFSRFDGAQFNHWKSSDIPLEKPDEFEEMVLYAEKLAQDFLFCRVDFFLVGNHIYFNEFTFTPAKGTLIFDNDEADFEIGEWLDISSAMKNKGT
ncbi:MAG: ATP-grasp fold amidoligase family protein [Bacilli bacterium]|nr:ATP-grasp fold amidoligase family protein [Bacilli bacterium]